MEKKGVSVCLHNKKAAMELSMSTIVILVLAMSMLILGLVLVKTIFTGAKYNVDTMNIKVQNEINKLFVEDEKMVVYLADKKLDVKQGQDWGVAFAIRNLITGTTGSKKFDYTIAVNMDARELKDSCGGLSIKQAEDYIKSPKVSSVNLLPGETYYDNIIRFSIPEGAPLCLIRYSITIKDYVSRNFDVIIKA